MSFREEPPQASGEVGSPSAPDSFCSRSFCIALMLLDHRDQHLTRVRKDCRSSCIRFASQSTCRSAHGRLVRMRFAERERLIAENEQLKRERLNSEFRLQRLAALEVENARLREMLDSTARVGNRALIAEILAVDLDAVSATVRSEPRARRRRVRRSGADRLAGRRRANRARGAADVGGGADHRRRSRRAGQREPQWASHDRGRHRRQRPLRLPYLTNNADVEVGRPARVVGPGRRVSGGLSGRPRHRGSRAARSVVRRDHRRAGVRARSRPRGAARVERGDEVPRASEAGEARGGAS